MSGRGALANKLAGRYGGDLPKSVTDRVFSSAWEHGHAAGDYYVETYYEDFADLAADAFYAGREIL